MSNLYETFFALITRMLGSAILWTQKWKMTFNVTKYKVMRTEARCIKLRSGKSAPAHPRAQIHSHATLRPRERPRKSTPVGAAHVVRP